MYIVVVGGGRVGYYLTKALLAEGHEVLVIEKDSGIVEEIREELGSIGLHGDGCEAATLAEAGTERADMLVAVTGEDEDNLVACQLSKHKFNVPRTIARIRNPQNEKLFKMLGVDVTISSTNVILEHIEQEVPTHSLTHLLSVEENQQELLEVRIPPEAATIGKQIGQLPVPPETKLALIIREGGISLLPHSNVTIQEGDIIIALTSTRTEAQLRIALTGL